MKLTLFKGSKHASDGRILLLLKNSPKNDGGFFLVKSLFS
jgi:hypothetical protein